MYMKIYKIQLFAIFNGVIYNTHPKIPIFNESGQKPENVQKMCE